jgi:hypothetical protein
LRFAELAPDRSNTSGGFDRAQITAQACFPDRGRDNFDLVATFFMDFAADLIDAAHRASHVQAWLLVQLRSAVAPCDVRALTLAV